MEFIYAYSIIWVLLTGKTALIYARRLGEILSPQEDDETPQKRFDELLAHLELLGGKVSLNLIYTLVGISTIIPLAITLYGSMLVTAYVPISEITEKALWTMFAFYAIDAFLAGFTIVKCIQAAKKGTKTASRYYSRYRKKFDPTYVRLMGGIGCVSMFYAALQLFMHLYL